MKTILLILCLLSVFACKSAKESELKASIESQQTIDGESRFIVSFISKGSSIDFKLRDIFVELLINSNLEYNKVSWGHEGEIDYCLELSDLTDDEQNELIEEIKNLLAPSTLVRYKENTPCRENK